MTLKQKLMKIRHQRALKESKRTTLLEARSRGIGDAFNTIYKQLAIQLQAEQKQEMEQWKKFLAAHQAKMNDINKRRKEAFQKFREAQAQLNAAGGISVDEIADNALDFDNV